MTNLEDVITMVAQVCHEANRAFCSKLGDNSQAPWSEAPDWQKRSAVSGVRFHLENPQARASHSHECWLEEKRSHGWTYGPQKSAEDKTHPCIVPFDQLPAEQQAKDYLFRAIVHGFIDSGLLALPANSNK